MWGNWSTTVRRTRLTPSYANSANLASDSIIYDPKFRTIGALQKILAAHAATILHTDLPINVSTHAGIRTITLAGKAGDPALSFYFNDGKAAAKLPGQGLAMAPTSVRIMDGNHNPLWYSEPVRHSPPARPAGWLAG